MTHSPPITRSRTTHALLLRVGGRTVGAIYKWNTTQRREVRPKYEVNVFSYGLPADVVPGTLSTRTIAVERVDLYNDILEECFGTKELVTLSDQTRPFNLREVWLAPGAGSEFAPNIGDALGLSPGVAGLLGASANALLTVGAGSGRLYEYRGSWFEDITRNSSADGDRVSRASGTLQWQWRVRVQ